MSCDNFICGKVFVILSQSRGDSTVHRLQHPRCRIYLFNPLIPDWKYDFTFIFASRLNSTFVSDNYSQMMKVSIMIFHL